MDPDISLFKCEIRKHARFKSDPLPGGGGLGHDDRDQGVGGAGPDGRGAASSTHPVPNVADNIKLAEFI